MLLLCDGPHARKWIKQNKGLFPEDSIILHNSKKGLFKPSKFASFSNGVISSWRLNKSPLASVLSDLNDNVILSSNSPIYYDLPKTVTHLFQKRHFNKVCLVSFGDDYSALMLYITLCQLELPESTQFEAKLANSKDDNLFNTAEFQTSVSRQYFNYYTRQQFKIKNLMAQPSELVHAKRPAIDLTSLSPMSFYILDLINNEPGMRTVFVGRNILDATGIESFLETPLRSAEIQFAIDGLVKNGLLYQLESKLFITDCGIEILSIVSMRQVNAIVTILLRPKNSYQVIDKIFQDKSE